MYPTRIKLLDCTSAELLYTHDKYINNQIQNQANLGTLLTAPPTTHPPPLGSLRHYSLFGQEHMTCNHDQSNSETVLFLLVISWGHGELRPMLGDPFICRQCGSTGI